MDLGKITPRWEWQTLALFPACYGTWIGSTLAYTGVVANFGIVWGVLLLFTATALAAAFHTSLQHEVVHGHPTPYPWLNEMLVFPSLILVYPFRRYRALHLQHHVDENLTDPYDDPESYFWPESDQVRLSGIMAMLLNANNTFVGRMVLGAPLGLYGFYKTEGRRLVANEPGVRLGWALHFAGLLPVIGWVVYVCQIPFWQYVLIAVYPGVTWILVRSFAEHKASECIGGRTAIVEAHPFFSMLYLNNNLHVVHHAHPSISWYDLPSLYRERKKSYLATNRGYKYEGYWQIVRKFAFRRKQSVIHPILRRNENPQPQSSERPSG